MSIDRVAHLVRLPVELPDGTYRRFLFDSGIGVTVIAPDTAKTLGLVTDGDIFTGRRMSGQALDIPLTRLPSLTVGEREFTDNVVGVFDLGPSEGPDGFDGILGLDLLGDQVVTVDPGRNLLRLDDVVNPGPGVSEVPTRVHRDGIAVTMHADLELPGGSVVDAEVDIGSGMLILDTRFMAECGITSDNDVEKTVAGTDQTGYEFVRRFAAVHGPVRLAGKPATAQDGPQTIFQDIIHDALIGTEFLDRFVYSFDVSRSRMLLAPI